MDLTLIKKTDLTPTVKCYTFQADDTFNFLPGQFVMLKQPGAEQKKARAFSIVGTPNTTEISFIMKHFPEGHVSGYLAAADIGAILESAAPVGRFTLNASDTDRVFIATGTGIAPIMSFLIAPQQTIPCTTLFGVRSQSDLFWTDRLPPGSLITLSQPGEPWTGLTGRVTEHVPKLITEHPNAAWYICGNPEMVKDVRTTLLSANIPTTSIHFEIY